MMELIVDFFAHKKILITGGAGYLAASIADMLRDVECTVVRVSRRPDALPRLTGRIRAETMIADVRDVSIWPQLLDGVDVVFHLAAQTSVYTANTDPPADLQANVAPMLALLNTCRQQSWAPSVIFAGTVTQVGLPDLLPVDERQPDLPVTIYDLHKLMAERYLSYYVAQGVVRGATLRLANVYGPGPRSSSADRGVLNLMIRRALAGEALTIYGSGEHIRDYIYIEDVARAFLLAAINADHLGGRYVVIGSGSGHTIAEAVHLVADRAALHTGRRAPVVHVEPPATLSPIESRNFVADTTAFRQASNWTAAVTLTDGIDRTIMALLTKEGDRS